MLGSSFLKVSFFFFSFFFKLLYFAHLQELANKGRGGINILHPSFQSIFNLQNKKSPGTSGTQNWNYDFITVSFHNAGKKWGQFREVSITAQEALMSAVLKDMNKRDKQ